MREREVGRVAGMGAAVELDGEDVGRVAEAV